jgi:NAD(P)-dependent dehydrogenase (short-subunit alcohol dehydrogenase family)
MTNLGSAIIIGYGPGVGAGAAEAFAKLGYPLALLARDPAKVELAAKSMADRGFPAKGFAADAGDDESLSQALAAATAAMGEPDILIYNAARARPGPVLDLAPEALVEDFRICVVGALNAARAVAPGMIARGRGSILFTGGGFALYPSPQAPALSIGKAGIRALALMLAAELAPKHIRVGTVTIAGAVSPHTAFSPERIGEAFVSLHQSAVDAGTAEIVFRG